ncbi:MAG: PstS family phosphate ABC transporter substrate-binding protein [Kofleriaceae bacterium]
MRLTTVCVSLIALLATTGGCSKRKAAGGTVTIDGSSTVFLISAAMAELAKPAIGVDVTVGSSGTGGGFKKFCAGQTDISGASRPIKPSEAEACAKAGITYVELPVAYDGIAVVVNTGNSFVDHLTVDELKAIWAPEAEGKITNWSQVRPGFPDAPLRLLGPGADSGTFDYFTAAVVGKEHASRGDFRQSEDDNVLVQGVSSDVNALGYFGFAYYQENKDKLKIVPIDDGKGEDGVGPITPSPASIVDGTYQPLARPIFIYVSVAAAGKPHVAKFVDFYLAKTAEVAAKVGYVALPGNVAELVKARYAAKKTGSAFVGGSTVGVTLEQLLATETK